MKLDRRLGRVEREAARSNEIPAAIAVDFLRGGSPSTAEAYDRKGAFLAAFARDEGETVLIFRNRVREAARALPGAMRVKLGGIAREPSAGFPDLFEGLPRGAVTLSESLRIRRNSRRSLSFATTKRVVLTCGRRWGKTVLLATIAVDAVLAGQSVGLFCPTFKFLGPLVEVIVRRSGPCRRSRSIASSARSGSRMAAASICGVSITQPEPDAAENITSP